MSMFRFAAYSLPVSAATVRSDYPQFSFAIFQDPPGQVWADFVHAVDEFVVIAEGKVTIAVGDECADCLPGDLVRIPAGIYHTLRTSLDSGSTWYYGYGRFEDNGHA